MSAAVPGHHPHQQIIFSEKEEIWYFVFCQTQIDSDDLWLCWFCGTASQQENIKNIIFKQNNNFIPFSSVSQLITEAKQMIEHLVTKDFTISFEIPQQGRVFGEQDIPQEEIIER